MSFVGSQPIRVKSTDSKWFQQLVEFQEDAILKAIPRRQFYVFALLLQKTILHKDDIFL